jgi:hypothetical protein
MLCTLSRTRLIYFQKRCFWSPSSSKPNKFQDKKEENQKESFQPTKAKDETNELDQPSVIAKIMGNSLRGINKGPPNPTSWNYVNKHFREDIETDMPLDEIVDGGGKILADETKVKFYT